MREPMIQPKGGDFMPFSQAPNWLLELRASGKTYRVPCPLEDGGWYDDDFRKRYAALLLQERGA